MNLAKGNLMSENIIPAEEIIVPPVPVPVVDIPRIAIIGGGISGLAAAHKILELCEQKKTKVDLILLESSRQVGGHLGTLQKQNCIIEMAADAIFTEKPWGLDFCKKLGLQNELIETNSEHRTSFISFQNKLIPVPQGFYLLAPSQLLPILRSSLFTWKGKLRIFWELFIPKKNEQTENGEIADESLGSFVKRRFGQEVLDRIAQPMVAGIYSVHPNDLSLKATFPQFLEWEKKYGSIIKALWKQPKLNSNAQGPRYHLFISFRKGMQTLIDACVKKLPEGTIQTGITIQDIQNDKTGKRKFTIVSPHHEIGVDAICLAVPCPQASLLVKTIDSFISQQLEKIRYSCGITVNFLYPASAIEIPKGFGFVVPSIENKTISGCTFTNIKFPNRAPRDKILIRAFVGGKNADNIIKYNDKKIETLVLNDLQKILKIKRNPIFTFVHRYSQSLPIYKVGHSETVQKIQSKVKNISGLALAGNGYEGVGIPDCVQSGELAAEKIMRDLLN